MLLRMEKPMKRIELPAVEAPLNACEVLQTVINAPIGGGITIVEMRKRLRIIDALAAAKGKAYVVLEDEEHAMLSTIISQFPFGMVSKDIDRIVTAVESAVAYQPNGDATQLPASSD